MYKTIGLLFSFAGLLSPTTGHAAFSEDELLLYDFDDSTSASSASESHSTGLDLSLTGSIISANESLDLELGYSWDSGNALYCDGTTATASHSDNVDFEPSDFTLSMWVYSDSFSDCNGDCTLVSKGSNGSSPSGYWLYTDSSGALSVDIGNGGATSTVSGGTLSTGTWHHVVLTLQNVTVSLYIDGQHQVLTNLGHYIAYSADDFLLCGIDSSTDYFKGYLDDFRLFDANMSASEVSAMYDWYTDSDGDGYNASDDCDMDSSAIYPGATELCDGVDNNCDGDVDEDSAADALTWYADSDNDTYGDANTTAAACSLATGYVANSDDCDDSAAAVNPGADETCDSIDNDCDGSIDENDAIDALVWYTDADSDGYGDSNSTSTACYQPSGSVSDNTDCDDTDADTNPSVDEYCDGHDDDCDGITDESDAVDASTWYADSDNDTYGDAAVSQAACIQPTNTVSDNTDCNDNAFGINPGVDEYCDGHDDDCDGLIDEDDSLDASTFYADADNDGFGDAASTTASCSQPSGYVSDQTDCNDGDSSINPSGTELCDTVDNDCNGDVDEDSAADVKTWYGDSDADGYGNASSTDLDCDQPSGFVDNDADCDDNDANTNPGANELCDTIDNNCDGAVDEDSAVDALTYYADTDTDGYGDGANSTKACTQPSNYLTDNTDCNDGNSSIYPGATEYCDTTDWDCDGDTYDDDSSDALTWYADNDVDGFGDPGNPTLACSEPSGYGVDNTDCNDTDAAINPIASEIWYDGVDQNCNNSSDYDQDLDGYDHLDYEGEDCDDEDILINPDAEEIYYDGVDQDCDEYSDYDYDGDGFDSETYGGDDCDDADEDIYPGAPDTPYDGLIHDCNNATDYDADGDGYETYLFGGLDCDDGNSEINPGVEEIWYDGLDQNCDDNDDDQDEDGFSLADDCDDEDPDAYPNAPGLDEDCMPIDTADTGGSDTGASDSGSSSDTGETTSPKDGVGFPDLDDGGGCACSSTKPQSAHWIWFWAMVGLVGLRRKDTSA
jgi:MYXO-CTERM domain-containing protein